MQIPKNSLGSGKEAISKYFQRATCLTYPVKEFICSLPGLLRYLSHCADQELAFNRPPHPKKMRKMAKLVDKIT